jgi:hypothetical protein
MEDETFESQRYGRNKKTQINNSYISSGHYRRKFDRISNNPELNKKLYELSKEMLQHRAGTLYEDMYWLNPDTSEIIAYEINGLIEEKVDYSFRTKKAIENIQGLITIHSHPNSYPPSAVDFNSNYSHGYAMGVIICHDGKIFVYRANEEIDEDLYSAYVKKYRLEGKTEFEAQWNALESVKENTDIVFKEVGAYE